MGNQEGSLYHTNNYDDSGFSDVATSVMDASYTTEYEAGLKSMFLNEQLEHQSAASSSAWPIPPTSTPIQTGLTTRIFKQSDLPTIDSTDTDTIFDEADGVLTADAAYSPSSQPQLMSITAAVARDGTRRSSLVKSRSIGIDSSGGSSLSSVTSNGSSRRSRTYSTTYAADRSSYEEETGLTRTSLSSSCSCEKCNGSGSASASRRNRTLSGGYSVSLLFFQVICSILF
jgi:hypothetical protein